MFIPSPFRGVGFVTFASAEVGKRVLNGVHTLHGARLNLEIRHDQDKRAKRDDGNNNNNNNNNNSRSSRSEDQVLRQQLLAYLESH